MKLKKMLCAVLALTFLSAVGCSGNERVLDSTPVATTVATYDEITANLGESASYGNMTLTVVSAEDPDITMKTGKKAMFFHVKVDNTTENQIAVNYLNNFTLTVNGTYYEADECCTIPVMKELYDFYNIEPLNEQLEAGKSCDGYIACEVDANYTDIELHFIPKTTDRVSRITVPISSDGVMKVKK